jgi:hypothetical protein
MNEIKWKRISSHHGTRVGYEARVGNRIIAQVNVKQVTQYTVFRIHGGQDGIAHDTLKAAKQAVEDKWYSANKGGARDEGN